MHQGDLAEHAVASPPPVDCDDDDEWDWDRFHYWNDIEYDSDGYHDVDTDASARKKRKHAQPAPKGKLKRRSDALESSPSKRRRGLAGERAPSATLNSVHSPVAWRQRGDRASTPTDQRQTRTTFALLKDWRTRFPDGTSALGGNSDDDDDDAAPPTADIDPAALLAALRANLAQVTGGAGGEELGLDENMLLQHIAKMLASDGASADDVAGELADALFARDDASVTSETAHDKRGDGDFGQWVLKQAEGNVAPEHDPPLPVSGQLSPPADVALDAKEPPPLKSPAPSVPAGCRPPTPNSSEPTGSQGKSDPAALRRENHPAASSPAPPHSRKRKAGLDEDGGEHNSRVPAKRAATRSFDAPTASSRARSEQTNVTRKASRAPKR
ncbi:MAG: hypothetical protein INR71_03670 [Terriglobus roseus]|nr:hypothetical protein [Terriglobus roseus]